MITDTVHALYRTPSFARRRLGTIVAGSTVILLALAGCSDEQRRDLGEVDVREVLEGHVEQAVADQDEDLEGGVDCAAEIDVELRRIVLGDAVGDDQAGDRDGGDDEQDTDRGGHAGHDPIPAPMGMWGRDGREGGRGGGFVDVVHAASVREVPEMVLTSSPPATSAASA